MALFTADYANARLLSARNFLECSVPYVTLAFLAHQAVSTQTTGFKKHAAQ
jgi:hypothetical protein